MCLHFRTHIWQQRPVICGSGYQQQEITSLIESSIHIEKVSGFLNQVDTTLAFEMKNIDFEFGC